MTIDTASKRQTVRVEEDKPTSLTIAADQRYLRIIGPGRLIELVLISDLLLAICIFHDIFYRPIDLVWLSYGVGQMLIVYGIAGYIRHGSAYVPQASNSQS